MVEDINNKFLSIIVDCYFLEIEYLLERYRLNCVVIGVQEDLRDFLIVLHDNNWSIGPYYANEIRIFVYFIDIDNTKLSKI
jgi:hypothetical protein